MVNKYQEALNSLVNNELAGNEITLLSELISKYNTLSKLLTVNIPHTNPEFIDGFYTGNVHIGMVEEDYNEILDILEVK